MRDDRVKTQVRIPRDLWARALAEAERRETSGNGIIILALRQFLEGEPPAPAAPPKPERQAGGDDVLDFD